LQSGVGEAELVLMGASRSHCQFDLPDADPHQGAEFQQLQPDRPADRLGEQCMREADAAQRTEQHICHGREPEAQLIGPHGRRRSPVGEQVELAFLQAKRRCSERCVTRTGMSGDQFIALQQGLRQPADDGGHLGLVVDAKEGARSAFEAAGVALLDGAFVAFRDPLGNRIEIISYDSIRFTTNRAGATPIEAGGDDGASWPPVFLDGSGGEAEIVGGELGAGGILEGDGAAGEVEVQHGLDAGRGIVLFDRVGKRAFELDAAFGIEQDPIAVLDVEDRAAAPVAREGELIVTRTALEEIVAGTVGEHVLARLAGAPIGTAIAGETVRVVGAGQVLDAGESVARSVATRGRAGCEIDGHTGERGGVIGGVEVKAAVEMVGARTARENVIAGIADDHVSARAGIRPVIAVLAEERVITAAILQYIVTAAPDEDVSHITVLAEDRSAMRAANDMLDPSESVACCVPALAVAGREIHHNTGLGLAIVDEVLARAAVQHVRAGAAHQNIVARAAEQRIVAGPTDQEIVAQAAVQPVVAGPAVEDVRLVYASAARMMSSFCVATTLTISAPSHS